MPPFYRIIKVCIILVVAIIIDIIAIFVAIVAIIVAIVTCITEDCCLLVLHIYTQCYRVEYSYSFMARSCSLNCLG